MKICFLYVPVPRLSVGKKIAKTLIEEKIVVCANILPTGTSIYPWKGKLETTHECYMLLKTTQSKAAKAEKRIRELHPYETPCIAQINIAKLNTDYAKWLNACLK